VLTHNLNEEYFSKHKVVFNELPHIVLGNSLEML